MVAATSNPPPLPQHLVLDNVDWPFYEHVLEKVGDGHLRVTYSHGRIEIMSPMTDHELVKRAIGSLVDILSLEMRIPMQCYGSATFRREDQGVGLEPDDCFYISNESRVRGMKQFDPSVDPPPDLAIEVDVSNSSIPRQPIYAALGVPELWRYRDHALYVQLLDERGNYVRSEKSRCLPFLPMREFVGFVERMRSEDRLVVFEAFRNWLRTLPR